MLLIIMMKYTSNFTVLTETDVTILTVEMVILIAIYALQLTLMLVNCYIFLYK